MNINFKRGFTLMNRSSVRSESAFTLIELLIVIAILGVLATVVIVAINPLQNLAKTRDAGRLNGVGQIGHAMEAYATNNNGVYVPESANWIGGGAAGTVNLVNAGEINAVPARITNSLTAYCTNSFPQNGFCYNATSAAGAGPIVIYSRLEANANISRCAAGQWAYAVYSSADGRAGIVCRASGAAQEPVAGTQTFLP